MKKNQQSLRDLCNTNQHDTTYIVWIPEEERERKGEKEHLPHLMKKTNLYFHQAQHFGRKTNSKIYTSRNFTAKLLKEEERKVLKESRKIDLSCTRKSP